MRVRAHPHDCDPLSVAHLHFRRFRSLAPPLVTSEAYTIFGCEKITRSSLFTKLATAMLPQTDLSPLPISPGQPSYRWRCNQGQPIWGMGGVSTSKKKLPE